MIRRRGLIRMACWVGVLAGSMLTAGCAHRHYRVYDAYYNDYHKWSDREQDRYEQWCHETHRDPERDIRKLPPEEQEEYWKWRHEHERGRH